MAYHQLHEPGYEMPEVPTEYKGFAYNGARPLDANDQPSFLPPQHMYNDPVVKKRSHPLRHGVCFGFSLLVGLLWLGPILFLLIVNLRGQMIGAAAWCPSDKECNVISYSNNSNAATAARSQRYDEDNHNLLGALQFVAKALEVWFVYLATSLLWQLTVLLARRNRGIPIGYMFTHLEFADLRILLDLVFYRASSGSRPHSAGGSRGSKMPYFVAVTVFLCLIANLMGPSVAVLLIPTLNWNNQTIVPTGQFNQFQGAQAPSGDNAIPGCTGAALQAGNLSCTNLFYGTVLDSLTTVYTNEMNQNTSLDTAYYETFNTAVTLEQAIPFNFNLSMSKNISDSSGVMWAPSRQLLRGLSSDFEGLYSVISGDPINDTIYNQFQPYNSSLEIVLQRYGPIVGVSQFPSDGNLTVTQVADDKQIRCYQNFFGGQETKCMRTGTGWNASNVVQNFTIDRAQSTGPSMTVTVYWADQAMVSNSPDPECFANGTVPEGANCDYNTIFAQGAASNSPEAGDRMRDMLVVEWVQTTDTGTPAQAFLTEFFPGYGFTVYSIDVTQIWPSLNTLETRNPPDEESLTPMVIHPAWFLAAWNVEDGGDVPSKGSDGSESAALAQFNLQRWFAYENSQVALSAEDSDGAWYMATGVNQYGMAHAASLVSYATTPPPANANSLPALQPLLWSNVYNKVWGWGIDSRTSKLGVTVCTLGALIVLARTGLLLFTRAKEHSAVGLLASAMRHQHQGEIDLAESELAAARLRYRLQDDKEELMTLKHVP